MSLHRMFTITPHGRLLNTRIGEPSLSPPDYDDEPEQDETPDLPTVPRQPIDHVRWAEIRRKAAESLDRRFAEAQIARGEG